MVLEIVCDDLCGYDPFLAHFFFYSKLEKSLKVYLWKGFWLQDLSGLLIKKQVCLGIPVLIHAGIKKKRPSNHCRQLIHTINQYACSLRPPCPTRRRVVFGGEQ